MGPLLYNKFVCSSAPDLVLLGLRRLIINLSTRYVILTTTLENKEPVLNQRRKNYVHLVLVVYDGGT